MRRICLAILLVAALALAYGLGRRHGNPPSRGTAARHVLYYVDPMHPAYKSDKPGTAPDCGMALVPVYADAAGAAPSALATALPPGTVSVDPATRRLLGIRTAAVERGGATRTIHVVGRVVAEDTRIYRINSGADGFVRATHDDSVGNFVKKDQKLADYYAPEFLAAASGFLAAVERIPGYTGDRASDGARFTLNFPGTVAKEGAKSIQGYTDRLRNLGMSDVQIRRVADSKQLPDSIDIVSPADGFILARNLSVGQHFEHDMEFYRIADLSKVWVVAEVYEEDAPLLRPGTMAQVALKDLGRVLSAMVTDSLPQSEAGGGTVKLRLEVDNPNSLLRPEMLADVSLPVRLPSGVTVPLDALVDTGARSRVYVETAEGMFEPREVETGWRSGERAEILRGVRPGDRVVVAATFLVDSESRLKAPASLPPPAASTASAMPAMTASKPATDPNCGMQVDPKKAAASGNTFVYRGVTYFFCSTKCKKSFESDPSGSNKRQGDD